MRTKRSRGNTGPNFFVKEKKIYDGRTVGINTYINCNYRSWIK